MGIRAIVGRREPLSQHRSRDRNRTPLRLHCCEGILLSKSAIRRRIAWTELESKGRIKMVTITFPDREAEKRALAFLIGRFSGRVLRSGEHIVPEAALEALADQNIPFAVRGKATYEQQMAALRGAASAPVQ
jgi:hypothetical protein